ncbi:hypothetical protein EGT74_13360 [Chitinophaga lutea]|uniref:Signal transduction histidine kinase internal region domain-containing protein n=1 Tax=Chitinophaga lutea TaxID=2488634 RepID=A0A3N4PIL2_9BACT|nr:sensor histidine kinase [Chitinophaga lutea]RPE08056.1 hypothetical protein EGT74_13360 [Chitinophaga lutea]
MVFLRRYFDVCIHAGLVLWLGIFNTLIEAPYTWAEYGRAVLLSGVALLPAIIFAAGREWLQQRLGRRAYTWAWLLCFVVLLPVNAGFWAYAQQDETQEQFIITGAILAFSLEVLLSSIAYYRRMVHQVQWLRKFSLDKALLATITIISLSLAAMATSCLYDPRYHSEERLLIGGEFSLSKIIRHFDMFLAVFAQFLFMYLCGYFFFYLNSRLLVVRVLKEKGPVLYVLGVLAAVALFYPVVAQLFLRLPANDLFGTMFSANAFNLENAFAALSIIFLSLPLLLALQWAKQNNRIVSLEKEKAQSELALLRQQLNPHFFFNTLNNLYAMSLQRSAETPESILQLSDLMRYVIYKGQEDQVTVKEEIRYLEDYVRLQMIRLKKAPVFSFEQDVTDDAMPVAPLLLIVLVENAFKHGVEPAENEARLHIRLQCNRNSLYFSCENSFETPATTGGIGLANLQKRLALLYPGRHTFTTSIKNHTFKAELQLTAR